MSKDDELDKMMQGFNQLTTEEEFKQAIKAYTESQVREAYDLLYWKYKELNGQSVDMKFVEVYNILTEELQAPKNGDSDE